VAKSKDKRINRLRALRRQAFRIIERAKHRKARRVVRHQRKRANRFLRLIRHRRKVVTLPSRPNHGAVWYDGKQVAAWIVPHLDYARRHGWTGHLTSGYRSIALQSALYYGAPGNGLIRGVTVAPPGASNHNYLEYPRGAVDALDYYKLRAVTHGVVLNGRRLVWYGDAVGSRDPVHFSSNGH
jgi:hypothetical protein